MEKKLAYRVKDLVAGGIGSRTTVYEAIKAKKLRARKRGGSTIILPDDLEEYLQNLPDFHDQAA
jgi:hypothetical protein